MKIDFFVHPEHFVGTKLFDKELYEKYIQTLEKAFDESEFPVLVEGERKGKFDNKFCLENTIRSNFYYSHKEKEDIQQGDINEWDWEKFTKITDKGDFHRIHGMFLGSCIHGFALQLFAYKKLKEHWDSKKTSEDIEFFTEQLEKKLFYEARGDFAKSGIKIGIVLDKPNKTEIQKPSFVRNLSHVPYGNLVYQLMDENTEIYRRDGKKINIIKLKNL